MDVRSTFALAAVLALSADVPGLTLFPSAPSSMGDTTSVAVATPQSAAPAPSDQPQSSAHSTKPLQPESRLLLIRYVDGEFAKLVQSLPAGKHGYKIPAGKPIDPQHLSDMLRLYGTAATQGDTVQITGIEFRYQQIVLLINGGGKKHFHLRDHLQIGIGGGDMSAMPPPPSRPPEIPGATLILDYGRPVPDMSPDDLKRDLSVLLDFSKQHSAAVNWIDTLPPQFQEAIKDHRAVVGMDQEMVIAAMGRPDKKVRERDPDGVETEDWIYGTPPGPTTFVTFASTNVIRVERFN
ncbi:MAG: hypothetical protein ABSG27_15030 [Candidatus Acidiferrales bacterium]|jgi:hypothetical protein